MKTAMQAFENEICEERLLEVLEDKPMRVCGRIGDGIVFDSPAFYSYIYNSQVMAFIDKELDTLYIVRELMDGRASGKVYVDLFEYIYSANEGECSNRLVYRGLESDE